MLLIVEVPSVRHHDFEVAIVVDARSDLSVVVHELLRAYLSIATLFVLNALMDFEGV